MENKLLTVEKLNISYGSEPVDAEISFSLKRGEILSVVGESGCGKTTLLKALLGLPDFGACVTGGHITFDGTELTALDERSRKKLLGDRIGMIFQDPGAAFNPIRSYKKQLAEMLKSHGRFSREDSYKDVLECFEKLGLPDGKRILDSCPYEMSGGMNQRISIAAAMLLKPELLLLDEPTSALDVTTQKTVVEELLKLRDLTGTAMIIVTHNLGIAAKMADVTGVMYAGRIVEYGVTRKVLNSPVHPYTKSLVAAIPTIDGGVPTGLEGQPPLCVETLDVCPFRDRCPVRNERCQGRKHELTAGSNGHYSSCWEGML